jgi:regulator of sirC expression with transglutaminase-like and TPR domain
MARSGTALRAHLADLAAAGDQGFDLAEAALVVAALDRPLSAVEGYLAYIGELAGEVRAIAAQGPGDAEALAAGLAEVVVRRHRFRADDRDDDDVANANLMAVIDHRRGVAEALGLLMLEVARRAGLAAEGLAFPSHFLMRLEDAAGRRVILDPVAGGRPLGPPEMRALLKATAGIAAELEPAFYQPLCNRDILLRLQNEIKLRLLRCGRLDRALEVVEVMLLFAPDRPALWREAGMMHMRLDNLTAAVAALEQFIARSPAGQARNRTMALVAELKTRLN